MLLYLLRFLSCILVLVDCAPREPSPYQLAYQSGYGKHWKYRQICEDKDVDMCDHPWRTKCEMEELMRQRSPGTVYVLEALADYLPTRTSRGPFRGGKAAFNINLAKYLLPDVDHREQLVGMQLKIYTTFHDTPQYINATYSLGQTAVSTGSTPLCHTFLDTTPPIGALKLLQDKYWSNVKDLHRDFHPDEPPAEYISLSGNSANVSGVDFSDNSTNLSLNRETNLKDVYQGPRRNIALYEVWLTNFTEVITNTLISEKFDRICAQIVLGPTFAHATVSDITAGPIIRAFHIITGPNAEVLRGYDSINACRECVEKGLYWCEMPGNTISLAVDYFDIRFPAVNTIDMLKENSRCVHKPQYCGGSLIDCNGKYLNLSF